MTDSPTLKYIEKCEEQANDTGVLARQYEDTLGKPVISTQKALNHRCSYLRKIIDQLISVSSNKDIRSDRKLEIIDALGQEYSKAIDVELAGLVKTNEFRQQRLFIELSNEAYDDCKNKNCWPARFLNGRIL